MPQKIKQLTIKGITYDISGITPEQAQQIETNKNNILLKQNIIDEKTTNLTIGNITINKISESESLLNIGNKIGLYINNEGGNISIHSPDEYNTAWEMDAYNGNFRLFDVGSSTFYAFPKTSKQDIVAVKSDIPTKVSQLTNDQNYVDTTYVDNKVAGIVNSAPETLDTLNELSKALGNDPNFATTISTQIGLKQAKLSDEQLANIDNIPKEYIKKAEVSNNSLTLTKQDNSTLNFQGKEIPLIANSDFSSFDTVKTPGIYNFIRESGSSTKTKMNGILFVSEQTNYGGTIQQVRWTKSGYWGRNLINGEWSPWRASLYTDKGISNWSSEVTSYAAGAIINSNKKAYIAKNDITTNTISPDQDTTNWSEVISASDLAAYLPKTGGTVTGPLSMGTGYEFHANEHIVFDGTSNPYIMMKSAGTPFYFQASKGEFAAGPTWDKATRWDKEGNMNVCGTSLKAPVIYEGNQKLSEKYANLQDIPKEYIKKAELSSDNETLTLTNQSNNSISFHGGTSSKTITNSQDGIINLNCYPNNKYIINGNPTEVHITLEGDPNKANEYNIFFDVHENIPKITINKTIYYLSSWNITNWINWSYYQIKINDQYANIVRWENTWPGAQLTYKYSDNSILLPSTRLIGVKENDNLVWYDAIHLNNDYLVDVLRPTSGNPNEHYIIQKINLISENQIYNKNDFPQTWKFIIPPVIEMEIDTPVVNIAYTEKADCKIEFFNNGQLINLSNRHIYSKIDLKITVTPNYTYKINVVDLTEVSTSTADYQKAYKIIGLHPSIDVVVTPPAAA